MSGQQRAKQERIIEAVRHGLEGDAAVDFVHQSGFAMTRAGVARHLGSMGGIVKVQEAIAEGKSNLDILHDAFPDDPKKSSDRQELPLIYLLAGIIITVIVLLMIFLLVQKKKVKKVTESTTHNQLNDSGIKKLNEESQTDTSNIPQQAQAMMMGQMVVHPQPFQPSQEIIIPIQLCPDCGNPKRYIAFENRYYCYQCQKY